MFVSAIKIQHFFKQKFTLLAISTIIFLIIASILLYVLILSTQRQLTASLVKQQEVEKALENQEKEVKTLKSQDQYLINKDLEKKINLLESTYKKSVKSYEQIVDLRDSKIPTGKYDSLLTQVLSFLAERNYLSAEAKLTELDKELSKQKQTAAASFTIPENVAQNNAPPGNGYQRQQVKADTGTFLVDIVAGDLNTTRVTVDTASDSDCHDGCPVLSLSDYVGRNGAYAGINGSYFCPASYPSCAGKTNSFDTLLMNKKKHYFNSENNVYSTVPAAIFSGNSARFVGKSLEWGRDTDVDAVIAMQPALILGGQVVFTGGGDAKQSSKGPKTFLAAKGTTVYIGVIQNATMVDSAQVLKTLGMDNAVNLDEGGSTALFANGRYIAGPGRNIPNAVLFVRK